MLLRSAFEEFTMYTNIHKNLHAQISFTIFMFIFILKHK